MRVPCVVRWPGKVPAGSTCDELTTMMDLLPTFASLAGATLSADRQIDGHDIFPLLSGVAEAKTPYQAFYYYYMDQLQAVRAGRWKLHLPLAQRRTNLRDATKPSAARLFDLQNDIGETTDVAAKHPEVVARLTQHAERARQDLGDRERPGHNQRAVGKVTDPQPQVLRN